MSSILPPQHRKKKAETSKHFDRVFSFLGKRSSLKFEQNPMAESAARIDSPSEKQLLQRAATVYPTERVGSSKYWKQKASQNSRRSIHAIFSISTTTSTPRDDVHPSFKIGSKAAPPSKRRLYTPPSMSFPQHIRTRSQPASCQLSSFPLHVNMPETTATNNPWWRSRHCLGTPPNADATSLSIMQHDARSRDSIGGGGPSRCNLIPNSLAEISTTSETCSSSDTSYVTCHSLVLEEGSEAHSTPTLLSSSPPLLSYTVEDEWQSKGGQANTMAFPKAMEDDYPDEVNSVEDWGEEPEGLAIDNLYEKVMTFISSDQPGRQARLRQYSSGDFTKAVALQGEPALKIETPTPLSTPSPILKHRLSLSEFLSELRALPTDYEVVCGDESFESSVMDDEEADSIQICRAWRQSIAFANLGASHPNQPLLQNTTSKESLNRAAITPSKPPVRHRLSRVSLQTLSLETIEEVAVAAHDLALPAPSSPSSEADSRENFDVCAHLLKRAKADIVSHKSV